MSLKQSVKRMALPRPGPRTLPFGVARGVRLHIDFQRQTGQYLGLYEIEVARWLRRLCRPGIDVFDVGARECYDAAVCAKLTGGRVLSFEADPANEPAMKETLALNPALAERISTVLGFVGDGSDGTVRLDDYVGEWRPGFVKVDVEGAEVDVLRGAARVLVEHRPAWLIETHSLELETECGRILSGHGYRPIVVHQRRVLPDVRHLEHNRWLVAPTPA